MKSISLLPVLAILAAASGCSNIERSRDLANPNVPPAVTAAQVCSMCHGIDGNSVSPLFPRLAGQPADYLVKELKEFREKRSSDPMALAYMNGLSRHLTDDQIKGLADYFAKQAPKPNAPVENAQQIAAGKEIYENGIPAKDVMPCMACHGPKGQGQDLSPKLANQHQYYLAREMRDFKETDKRPGTSMKEVTHSMTHEEMEAVAGYLQALPIDK